MKQIMLYGAGDVGQRWLQKLGSERVYCFIDGNKGNLKTKVRGKNVLSIQDIIENDQVEDKDIFISTGEEYHEEIKQLLCGKGLSENIVYSPYDEGMVRAPLDTFIDVTSTFEGGNYIGKGCRIIGSYIGLMSYVTDGSNIINAHVGRFCSIAKNVKVIIGQHPTHYFVSTHPVFFSPENGSISSAYVDKTKFDEYRYTESGYSVDIGNDVWIGEDVRIMEGVSVGDGAVLASGAVITKNVEPYEIVGGIPASRIRMRFDQSDIDYLLQLKWWNKDEKWLREHADSFDNISKLKQQLKMDE